MKFIMIIALGLCGSWYLTDISSPNFMYSGLAPFGVFVFLCALLIWLVAKAGFGSKADSSSSSSGGFLGGGDSGGGDGGC